MQDQQNNIQKPVRKIKSFLYHFNWAFLAFMVATFGIGGLVFLTMTSAGITSDYLATASYYAFVVMFSYSIAAYIPGLVYFIICARKKNKDVLPELWTRVVVMFSIMSSIIFILGVIVARGLNSQVPGSVW